MADLSPMKSKSKSSSNRKSSLPSSVIDIAPTVVAIPATTFDPKTFFVAQSVCRLTAFDRFGNERQGSGFLCILRQPLRSINRYGIVTNSHVFVDSDGRSFNDAGTMPTVLIDAHFSAHTHQHTVPLVVRRDIVKWYASRAMDIVFLELRTEADFLRRKSYNFLPLSLEPACENQRLMIFRYPTKENRSPRCGSGKIVQVCQDEGYIKWDHSVPNLPAGTPLIVAETLKVVGLHQTDRCALNGDNKFDHAISIKAFISEMFAKGFLDDNNIGGLAKIGSLPNFNSANDSSGEKTSSSAKLFQNGGGNKHNAFGSLLKSVSQLRNAVSPRKDMDLQLSAIRDSSAIADNLKDGICSVLQRHALSTCNLSNKSEQDLRKLFQRDQMAAIVAWKQEIDTLKKDKLEQDAAHLHLAAKKGDITVVSSIFRDKTLPRQWLVEHRDTRNYNNTPLIQAALNGHLNIVQFLVNECNANVNAKDGHELESTAIHLAAAYGHVDVVAFLADHNSGVLVEAKNKNNDTPLNRAATHGHFKVVEFLVDQKRANVENRGELGRSPLLMASAWGHLLVVSFLIKRGANFFAKDTETESMAPHLAAYFGHANVVHFFLDHFPDIFSLRNRNGKTPLGRARAQQKLNVVHLLTSRGARE